MTNKYGYFKEHPYLRPGLPPLANTTSSSEGARSSEEDTGPKDRDHGLNMKATVGRTGKLNDATFTKFIPHLAGDKYVDPFKRMLQNDLAKKKHNLVEVPFKMTSPMKKSVTPGDYFGTSGKVEYIAVPIPAPKLKGEVLEQPKGIYTAPAKKGSFGMNKYTLSEKQGYKGVATEYEYHHDPETVHIQRKRDAMEADRKARVTEAPFRPSNPAKKGSYGIPNTTISKGKGVAGEWEYVILPPAEGSTGKPEKEDVKPFKPSYAFAGTKPEKIEYIHDPEQPKIESEAARKKAESARIAATGAWKPNLYYKSDMVKSIVRMNIR